MVKDIENLSGVDSLPLLSIVVPVYNVEKYLRQCLDSLINQTLKNIEIIIVNDCSPDNSEAIIEEYAAKDPRIVYLKHTQNLCLGGARNTGIRAARGEYITFVDSDDYVDRRLYQEAVKAFVKHGVDIVVLPYTEFTVVGCSSRYRENFYRGLYQVRFDNLLLNTCFSAWSKVYRRRDIIEHKLIFPEHSYWEDISFWAEVCTVIKPTAINLQSKVGYYWYRQRSDSISNKFSKNYVSLPNMFTFTYQSLSRRSILPDFCEDFYNFVSSQTKYVWPRLGEPYKADFVKNFCDFTRTISFTDEQKLISPEWFLMSQLRDPAAMVLLMDFYIDKVDMTSELTSNRWYRFGKMTRKEKFQTIIRGIFRYFLKLLGLSSPG